MYLLVFLEGIYLVDLYDIHLVFIYFRPFL